MQNMSQASAVVAAIFVRIDHPPANEPFFASRAPS